jgi:hypothetical protein
MGDVSKIIVGGNAADRAAARHHYLECAEFYLRSEADKDLLPGVLKAYAATLPAGEALDPAVRLKIAQLLQQVHARDERTWAKFLSVHVGFTDMARLLRFKRVSPFRSGIIVETDVVEGVDDPVALRGESREYIAAHHNDEVMRTERYDISTHKDETKEPHRLITRSVVVVFSDRVEP